MSVDVDKTDNADTDEAELLHSNQPAVELGKAELPELTERQKAIARGEDPNDIEPVKAEAAEVETPVEKEEAEANTSSTSKTWIDSEVKAFAGTYGLTDEELSGFSSRDDFDRFTKMVDKKLSQPAAPTQSGQANTESTEKTDDKSGSKTSKVSLDVEEYRKNGYDEETIRLVEHSKMLEDEVTAMRAQHELLMQERALREQHQTAMQFHEIAETLDQKRFGKLDSPSFSKEHDEARRKLWEEADLIIHGIRERARVMGIEPVIPPLKEVISRAYRMGFGGDVQAEATKTAKEQLLRQSKNRRPVQSGTSAVTRRQPLPKTASLAEQAAHIANNPKIAAMYDKMQEEAGFN